MGKWSPTGKPVVPKNLTHLRQPARRTSTMAGGGFGGSSAGERNPPKHGRSIAERVPIRSYAFLHGQGRGLLHRRMTFMKRVLRIRKSVKVSLSSK